MAAYDDTDNTRIFHIGVWGFMITALVALYAQGLYQWFHKRLVDSRTVEQTSVIKEIERQEKDLNNYVPLDLEKGRYGIPIEKAMQETLEELKSQPEPTAFVPATSPRG